MFIIKKNSDNTLHLWSNNRKDDFIKYLPKNLNTTHEDLEIYQLPDKAINHAELDRIYAIKNENGVLSLDVWGGINIIDEENELWEYKDFIQNYPTKLLTALPYDENGDFIELEEFIPQS